MSQQHYYLIIQRAAGDPGAVGPLLENHKDWLREHLAGERLVLTGTGQSDRAETPDAGFLIVRADDFAQARALADSDPFIREGVRTYEALRITPMNGMLKVSFWGAEGALR
jgi:uncharacterized protein